MRFVCLLTCPLPPFLTFSLAPSLTHPPIQSLTQSLTHWSACSVAHLFTDPPTNSLTPSLVPCLTHLLTHAFTHPLTHSLICSCLAHSLTHSPAAVEAVLKTPSILPSPGILLPLGAMAMEFLWNGLFPSGVVSGLCVDWHFPFQILPTAFGRALPLDLWILVRQWIPFQNHTYPEGFKSTANSLARPSCFNQLDNFC